MVVFILVSEFFGKNFLVLFLDSFEISEQHLILSRILKGFLRRFLFGFQAFITALVNFTCSIYLLDVCENHHDLKHCRRAIRKLYVNTPAQLCAIRKMLVCVLEMLINYRKSHSILVLRQMCLKADLEIGFITFRTISRRRAWASHRTLFGFLWVENACELLIPSSLNSFLPIAKS